MGVAIAEGWHQHRPAAVDDFVGGGQRSALPSPACPGSFSAQGTVIGTAVTLSDETVIGTAVTHSDDAIIGTVVTLSDEIVIDTAMTHSDDAIIGTVVTLSYDALIAMAVTHAAVTCNGAVLTMIVPHRAKAGDDAVLDQQPPIGQNFHAVHLGAAFEQHPFGHHPCQNRIYKQSSHTLNTKH